MRAFGLALIILVTLLGGRGSPAAEPSGFVVITNPANPANAIDRQFLSDAFLKKRTRWSDDEAIRPVDLAPRSPVRRQFSSNMLGRTVEQVKAYWQQIVFSGRGVPPPELDSIDAVIEYVHRNPGALGYVAEGARLDGVKVLTVR